VAAGQPPKSEQGHHRDPLVDDAASERDEGRHRPTHQNERADGQTQSAAEDLHGQHRSENGEPEHDELARPEVADQPTPLQRSEAVAGHLGGVTHEHS
jgi:hypothetical protein